MHDSFGISFVELMLPNSIWRLWGSKFRCIRSTPKKGWR
jgi:hypothetical protein